jgi:hypothetical protein
MKRRTPVIKFPVPMEIPGPDDRHWHNGGDIEISMYARSLHEAARSLIASLALQPNTNTAWDACPVVLLYRQAIELHLKTLVDEGGDFLKERTDSISLLKTHSLRWLAQIVGQIIKVLKWENEFKCDGVPGLTEFSTLISEREELDPVAVAVRPGNRRSDGWVPNQLLPPNVVQFGKKLDGLIALLEATADALSGTADQNAELLAPRTFPPTIQ